MLTEESIKIVEQKGWVELVLNRPEKENSVNADMLQSLLSALNKMASQEMACLVLKAAGQGHFCSGLDLTALCGMGPRPAADFVELGQRALGALEKFPRPTLAVVAAPAYGAGLELILACDMVLAYEQTHFCFNEPGFGLIPALGSLERLISRVGPGCARLLTLGGARLSAPEALERGLVDGICPKDLLEEEAHKWVAGMQKHAPLALVALKRVLGQALEPGQTVTRRSAVDAFLRLFESADAEEGINASLQKRPANFRGK
jgi:enoyl-CoA hydratase/carnithine racemase